LHAGQDEISITFPTLLELHATSSGVCLLSVFNIFFEEGNISPVKVKTLILKVTKRSGIATQELLSIALQILISLPVYSTSTGPGKVFKNASEM